MYLKSIELHGFKSFANKTVLNFTPGITAIVGPNGSGKSNVADAVRWVLGEQKVKQLRSSNMQDVIFSGTEIRKPQGFAYVSITLDNSDRKLDLDYDEVVVSRRLYRSGESEYMLNGSQVRLKDISELFYDTGIGKEGYSIIGQGQIEKIISDKPEDKRELFDEAVGITKYKRRKAIALKKLEDEQLNVTRVKDIIKELDRQVGPLKKQSEDAMNYLRIRDELLLYESNYAVRELNRLADSLDEAKKNEEIVRNDLEEHQKQEQEIKEKFSKIDNEITNIDLEIAEIKDNVSTSNTQIETFKGRIDVLNEQINSETHSKETRDARIKEINDDMSSHLGLIEDNLNIVDILKSQIEFIKNNDKTNEMSDFSIDDDLTKARDYYNNSLKDVRIIMGDDYCIDNTRISKETLFGDSSFIKDVDEKRNELDLLFSQIKDLNDEINNLTNENISNSSKLNQINNDIISKQNEYNLSYTKLETLNNFNERYEGYGNVVKSIMDKKTEYPKIKLVVADLIDTKEIYETCIETALGNTIQNIVTEDTNTAKEIINYLKEEKLGRATFLPLSTIKSKYDEIYDKALKEEGVVDLASNLVSYDSEYDELVKYLLGRCLIVENIDYAININKKYNQNLKIVTLQGELLAPGGSIAGGTFKNASSLMGRRRELDALKVNCTNLKNEIDQLNIDKQKIAKVYDDTYYKIDELKNNLSKLEIDKNTITLNIISDIKIEYSSMSTKLDYTCQDLSRLTNEYLKLYEDKCSFEDEGVSSESIIQSKEIEISDIKVQIENLKKILDESEGKVAERTKEKEELLLSRSDYFNSTDKIKNEIIDLEKELLRLQNQIEKCQVNIEDISTHLYDEYQLTIKECESKYNAELNDMTQLKQLIKERQKIIKEIGPINVNAIEEYKSISSRYELLNTQYNDLTQSEETIKQIIKELDDGMRKVFNENFKVIQTEFNRVFVELFGGGKARLELDNDETKDILEQGIIINAQPPGKKLQNMMQLSGGEKALTAIAILFAIQYLKPSPFCMLDEIEAALDEGNIDRFAYYVRKLNDITQFILITHRRGTMEKADRLYGITMQEKGVSALVSVDLIADQLDK